ncbi:MAG: 30S ribosomal protein S9 [Candidatus Magasanikbacteria bacterium CG11_big_fil_rev_8_21_14_0_20_39_34]|uniref:Small ribosomal subunit protein uS9 n=1 Tax=Candidatus Magasanikbacteria bacterium CG11_big_fil_rev_8_21_14_0_20_39_34 TaxID=1974653 RepID=A0A2H0N5D4_9BACT|nr:MAG: 30S ribosomal protein S9 [Candidatus Magasanikbacteria bacterium CG11_big_fil_rev_8_21_14_0_20_39_34]
MSVDTTVQSKERAVGRRKTAAARVQVLKGKGSIVINGKELKAYFPHVLLQQTVLAPLALTGREATLDISVKVAGGGKAGQAEAIRHGIARALIQWDEALKPVLKAEGYLTRDPRAKERKKFGRRRARRGHQWRKR